MGKITLGQLLQYFDKTDDPVSRIQIVTGDQDWDCADELGVNSLLLIPFMDWTVEFMGCDQSYAGKMSVVRVYIEQA